MAERIKIAKHLVRIAEEVLNPLAGLAEPYEFLARALASKFPNGRVLKVSKKYAEISASTRSAGDVVIRVIYNNGTYSILAWLADSPRKHSNNTIVMVHYNQSKAMRKYGPKRGEFTEGIASEFRKSFAKNVRWQKKHNPDKFAGSAVEEVEEIEPQGSTPVKERKKKAANDPWAAKREIGKRLRAIASRVEDIHISEDAYVFGDFGPSYKRSVNAGMKKLDGLATKLESAVKTVIDKIED